MRILDIFLNKSNSKLQLVVYVSKDALKDLTESEYLIIHLFNSNFVFDLIHFSSQLIIIEIKLKHAHCIV